MYHKEPTIRLWIFALLISLLLHLSFFVIISRDYVVQLLSSPDEVEIIEVKDVKWITDLPVIKPSDEVPRDFDILSEANQEFDINTIAPYGYKSYSPETSSKGKGESDMQKYYQVGDKSYKIGLNKPSAESLEGDTAKGPIAGDDVMLPDEFYRDYRIGDKTYLNMARFKGAKYFVKIQKMLSMTYNPYSAIMHYKMSGALDTNHLVTMVAVSIDEDGYLSELFIIKGSGYPLFDQEVIRTFRASEPFLFPPKNLLNDDKHLNIAIVIHQLI